MTAQESAVAMLSRDEADELTGREERIIAAGERADEAYAAIGRELMGIRDGRLYRQGYATFEDYCQRRWGMRRWYADRLIAAGEVCRNLSAIALTVEGAPPPPANEAQARPLAALPPAEQPAAWRRAVETAPDGRVTAAHVARVVAASAPSLPSPSATLSAVTAELVSDGAYYDATVSEAYHRLLVRLGTAAREARALIDNTAPEEVARVAQPPTDASMEVIADLCAFVSAVFAAHQAPREQFRRVK